MKAAESIEMYGAKCMDGPQRRKIIAILSDMEVGSLGTIQRTSKDGKVIHFDGYRCALNRGGFRVLRFVSTRKMNVSESKKAPTKPARRKPWREKKLKPMKFPRADGYYWRLNGARKIIHRSDCESREFPQARSVGHGLGRSV